ncbi:hypothetical protein [Prevotella sp. P3-122]|uniref:hypothetical protein n=1 Tax=Prevotella sp. P3-122 TaxID=2024223 RepID=UPI000B96BC79|nr:hypothetical protein [Prevotella sp. P3-122]OYP61314.1 hypothetical protein CIL02_06555 [Prevotella sp. P3-122]
MTSNQSQYMKCTLTAIIVALLSLAAVMLIPGTCSSPYNARLQRIDSLMDRNPQAAYDSLSLFDSLHLYDDDKASRMRLLMLKAKAQNKLYLPMPSDTIFNEVVSYYDRHGSANDRMLSRYLLGCIYRDMKKYPQTILAYQDAICFADTTETGCDYYLLSCIYSQMGRIYASCNLPSYARKSYNKSIWYSIKSEHIREAIFDMEALAYLDYIVGDTLDAVKHALETEKLYRKHGFIKESFSVYPIFIYSYLCRGQYEQAYRLMKKYRLHSGNFDAEGNLKPGREHYYKALGQYFLGISRNDSAEYYFRKLGNYNFGYESAQGLLKVYSVKNDNDSVSKYTRLCEAEMDSILTQKKASELIQASSSHTFDRIKPKANKSRKILTVIALLCAVVAVVLVFYGRRLFRKYKSRIANLGNSLSETEEAYRQISNSHKKAICEVDKLRSQLDYSNEEHKKEIYDLTFKKEQLSASLYKLDINASMEDFKKSHIYLVLKERTRIVPKNNNSQDINWVSFRKEFSCHFPLLYTTLTENKKLSHQEFKVCALLWLGFENKEIANLINCKAQVVSNAKASANEKLFSDKSAKTLLGNMQNTAVAITGAQQKQEVTGTII